MKTYKQVSQEAQLDEAFPAAGALAGPIIKGGLWAAGAEAVKNLLNLGGKGLKATGKMAKNTLKGEPGEKKQQEVSTPSPDGGLPRAS